MPHCFPCTCTGFISNLMCIYRHYVCVHLIFLLYLKDCVRYKYNMFVVSERWFSSHIKLLVVSDGTCSINLGGLQAHLRGVSPRNDSSCFHHPGEIQGRKGDPEIVIHKIHIPKKQGSVFLGGPKRHRQLRHRRTELGAQNR